MPHDRIRHGLDLIKKLASFSPLVGVVGLRQVGKTTLLCKQLGIDDVYSFDDPEIRNEARSSSKTFLGKLNLPCVLDEVQKAPEIFDSLKLRVDRKRIPGQYYLTGSTEFSSKLGIRESLTGRIATLQLFPLTLSEAHQLPLQVARTEGPIHSLNVRFPSDQAMNALTQGGLPVPMFMRDSATRALYFDQWIETALLRDLARVYGRNYDMDIAVSILERMGGLMREGRMPGLGDFKTEKRKLRNYLSAMESIFLLKRIPCHEAGTGLDRWIFGDAGLAAHFIKTLHGEEVTLSLARQFVFNEILANTQYSGHRMHPRYFKSAQAKEAVDLIWNDIPIKIVHAPPGNIPLGWYEKPVLGAMKKLGSKIGLIVAPVDRADLPKSKGIGIVPWTYWS
ncbi:MAG: AAA family ATPase [Bdellovibrionia bacterium]